MTMFRQMRRFKQQLPPEECDAILLKNSSGVLAVQGDEGYPYTVPMSYNYCEGKLYFHCAKTGHKLDAVRRSDKVSFCVVDKDTVVPEKYTTYFRSVVAFGRARILEDETERREALEKLAAKYSPEQAEGRQREVDMQLKNVSIIEMAIEHITAKEAIELINARQAGK